MKIHWSFKMRRLFYGVLSRLSLKMTLFFAAMFAVATAVSFVGTRVAVETYA
jgi:hypothetical protein